MKSINDSMLVEHHTRPLTIEMDPKSSDAKLDCNIGSTDKQVARLRPNSKNVHEQGKENQNKDQFEPFCFECKRSLSKSRHLINIAGRLHRWHPECFRCDICCNPLDKETSCHIYKDKIVCRDDYAKLQRDNSVKCSRCRWPIGASDWVRKAGDYVYHLACFSCDICMRQLNTGEQFTISMHEKGMVQLLCRLHFAIDANNQKATPQTAPGDFLNTGHTNERPISPNPFEFNCQRANCISSERNEHHLHQHQNQSYLQMLGVSPPTASSSINIQSTVATDRTKCNNTSESAITDLSQSQDEINTHLSRGGQQAGTSNSSNSSTSGLMNANSKSKRVRTTFTEDQLSILQTHFQIDSNPDGQDLERIATITGLSKRVTQVWFQNSRARHKKQKPIGSSLANAAMVAGGSGLHTQFHSHRHSQRENESSDTASTGCYRLQQNEHRHKWSNVSDRSDMSPDAVATLDELDDNTTSSVDQLIVSEDSRD